MVARGLSGVEVVFEVSVEDTGETAGKSRGGCEDRTKPRWVPASIFF